MPAERGVLTRAACAAAFAVALALSAFEGDAVAAEKPFRLINLDGYVMKWGAATKGTGATVTYAFATRPTTTADARNCKSMKPLSSLLSASRIAPAAFRREVAAAFAMWSAAADIIFRRVRDPEKADILIGAQGKPRGRAYANVDFDTAVGRHVGRLQRSLICLNPRERWKIGFDGNLQVYDLRFTIAHEIGHAIGLDHPGPEGGLMGFRYDERYRTLQPGDIAGVVALYGQRRALTMKDNRKVPSAAPDRNGQRAQADTIPEAE